MADKDVSTLSEAQDADIGDAAMVRTVVAGTKAMRAAREIYLPKEKAEDDDSYSTRLKRSVLFNATGKTVDDMTGKVFTKPIILKETVPAPIKKYAENIDLAGRHLNLFARDVFADAMQSGIGFILVDMPSRVRPDGSEVANNRAAEAAAGIRPYLTYYPLESLLGWLSETVNGVETLTQVRFRETVSEPDGEWHEKSVEQVRVLSPGKWQTYRKVKEHWQLHEEGTTSIMKVPVVPVYLNRKAFMRGRPPLQKLAEKNVEHWQSSSDQRNILHVARVPILFGAGFSEEAELVIGANTMIRSSETQATLTFVEHTGKAIGAGREDLKDIEHQMQTMGLQLLVPKPGQTATGEIRDDAKENSPLAMMANGLGDAIELAFGLMAEFDNLGGSDSGGEVVVNTDFGIRNGAEIDLQILLSAVASGTLSRETFWSECVRRGLFADDFDPEREKQRLISEAPDIEADEPMDLDGE